MGLEVRSRLLPRVTEESRDWNSSTREWTTSFKVLNGRERVDEGDDIISCLGKNWNQEV